jgi:hypothetical protein
MTLRALYHWFFVTKTYFPVVRLFAEHEAEMEHRSDALHHQRGSND